jgi:hypothetical protein
MNHDSTLEAPSGPEVSLIRGGPFYRLQESTRLIAPDEWNVGRRIIFLIAVGWVPLLLMKLLFDRGRGLGAAASDEAPVRPRPSTSLSP